jgi:RNA polymerase sigma-70 factor (ECF subfamily)
MKDTIAFLLALKEMDEEALTKAFDLYAHDIFKYVVHNCGNVVIADQIVGDVFSKLLDQLSQGNGPVSNLRSYLVEIAYHAMVDEVRHDRRMAPLGELELALPATDYTDTTAEEHMLVGIILQAIQFDLTDDQRHVIILRFLEGFSLKETALLMGKKINNIKVTQNRAVAALRKAIDRQTVE